VHLANSKGKELGQEPLTEDEFNASYGLFGFIKYDPDFTDAAYQEIVIRRMAEQGRHMRMEDSELSLAANIFASAGGSMAHLLDMSTLLLTPGMGITGKALVTPANARLAERLIRAPFNSAAAGFVDAAWQTGIIYHGQNKTGGEYTGLDIVFDLAGSTAFGGALGTTITGGREIASLVSNRMNKVMAPGVVAEAALKGKNPEDIANAHQRFSLSEDVAIAEARAKAQEEGYMEPIFDDPRGEPPPEVASRMADFRGMMIRAQDIHGQGGKQTREAVRNIELLHQKAEASPDPNAEITYPTPDAAAQAFGYRNFKELDAAQDLARNRLRNLQGQEKFVPPGKVEEPLPGQEKLDNLRDIYRKAVASEDPDAFVREHGFLNMEDLMTYGKQFRDKMTSRYREIHPEIPVAVKQGLTYRAAMDNSAPATTPQERMVTDFLAWFDTEVRYFDGNTTFWKDHQGLNFVNKAGVLFVRRGATLDELFIIGHEFGHSIRSRDPDTWRAIVQAIDSLPDRDGVLTQAFNESYLRQGEVIYSKTPAEQLDEAYANVFGNLFQSKEFWTTVKTQNPTLYGRAIDYLNEILDKLSRWIRTMEQELHVGFPGSRDVKPGEPVDVSGRLETPSKTPQQLHDQIARILDDFDPTARSRWTRRQLSDFLDDVYQDSLALDTDIRMELHMRNLDEMTDRLVERMETDSAFENLSFKDKTRIKSWKVPAKDVDNPARFSLNVFSRASSTDFAKYLNTRGNFTYFRGFLSRSKALLSETLKTQKKGTREYATTSRRIQETDEQLDWVGKKIDDVDHHFRAEALGDQGHIYYRRDGDDWVFEWVSNQHEPGAGRTETPIPAEFSQASAQQHLKDKMFDGGPDRSDMEFIPEDNLQRSHAEVIRQLSEDPADAQMAKDIREQFYEMDPDFIRSSQLHHPMDNMELTPGFERRPWDVDTQDARIDEMASEMLANPELRTRKGYMERTLAAINRKFNEVPAHVGDQQRMLAHLREQALEAKGQTPEKILAQSWDITFGPPVAKIRSYISYDGLRRGDWNMKSIRETAKKAVMHPDDESFIISTAAIIRSHVLQAAEILKTPDLPRIIRSEYSDFAENFRNTDPFKNLSPRELAEIQTELRKALVRETRSGRVRENLTAEVHKIFTDRAMAFENQIVSQERALRMWSALVRPGDVRAAMTMIDGIHRGSEHSPQAPNVDAMKRSRQVQQAWPLLYKLRENGLQDAFFDPDNAFSRQVFEVLSGKRGPDTIKEAVEIADLIKDIYRIQVAEINQAGGSTRFLEDFTNRTEHNPTLMRDAGFSAWHRAVIDMIDWRRTEESIGMDSMNGNQKEVYLRSVYDDILTRGESIDDIVDMGGSVATALSRSRHIHFLPGKSFDYDLQFGSMDPARSLMEQIIKRSDYIVLMENFGPNFRKSWAQIKDTLELSEQTGSGRWSKYGVGLDGLFDTVIGALDTPVNRRLSSMGNAARSMMNTIILGKAGLSAISDSASMANVMQHSGVNIGVLDARFWTTMKTAYKRRKHPEHMNYFMGLGAGLNAVISAYSSKVNAQTPGHGFAREASDLMFNGNALRLWTDSAQIAIMDIMTQHLATAPYQGKLGDALGRFGITEAEFNIISKFSSDVPDLNGPVHRLSPDMFEAQHPAIARKLRAYLDDIMRAGVLEADVGTRFLTRGGIQSGTVSGESARSVMQYLAVPITIHRKTLMRLANGYGDDGFVSALMDPETRLAANTASFIGTSLAMGYVATLLKDIANLREPRVNPFATAQGTRQLIYQSGLAGILGDTVWANNLADIPNLYSGPLLGSATDVGTAALSGDTNRFLFKTLNLAPGTTYPVIGEIWTRLIGAAFADAKVELYRVSVPDNILEVSD
jgi:hypothetical protein